MYEMYVNMSVMTLLNLKGEKKGEKRRKFLQISWSSSCMLKIKETHYPSKNFAIW